MVLMARDVGRMGQHHFAGWCSSSGLSANQSTEDMTGWDVLVETPGVAEVVKDGEIDEPSFTCKVQVKASDQDKLYVDIILDKLWRLVTDPYPSFVVLIQYCGDADPRQVYIRHIDNELIRKVLKKIYELEQQTENSNLNRRTLRVHFDVQNPLSQPYGETLAHALNQHVPEGMNAYVREKMNFNKQVGHEEGSLNMHVTITGEENIDRMFDQSVGVQTSYEVGQVVGHLVRFGVKRRDRTFNSSGGMLAIQPTHRVSATLALRFEKYSAPMLFNVDFIPSPFNSVAPPERHLVRICNTFLDLRINPFTGRARSFVSYNGHLVQDIFELRDQLSIVLALARGRSIMAELRFPAGESVDFEFGAEPPEGTSIYALETQHSVVSLAIEILQICHWRSPVRVSVLDLLANQDSLFLLHDMLTRQRFALYCEFSLDVEFDPEIEPIAIHVAKLQIGGMIVSAMVTFSGKCRCIDIQRYAMEGKPTIVRLLTHDSIKKIDQHDIDAFVEELISKNPDATYVGIDVNS